MSIENNNSDQINDLRQEIAKGLSAIGRCLEIMQANVFFTRSLMDVLDNHGLLRMEEVRAHSLQLAKSAAATNETIKYLFDLLERDFELNHEIRH